MPWNYQNYFLSILIILGLFCVSIHIKIKHKIPNKINVNFIVHKFIEVFLTLKFT